MAPSASKVAKPAARAPKKVMKSTKQASMKKPAARPPRRAKGSQSEPRMLLVSDAVPEYERLIQACLDNVIVVPIKYDAWSLDDLLAAIKARCEAPNHQFASIGIIEHGRPGVFQLLKKVDGNKGVDLRKIHTNASLSRFLKTLATYVRSPEKLGAWQSDQTCRIDLLACEVVANDEGKELIRTLEEMTKVNWTASENKTGNPSQKADFIMESDKNIDVAPCYFNVHRLRQWRHRLPFGIPRDWSDSWSSWSTWSCSDFFKRGLACPGPRGPRGRQARRNSQFAFMKEQAEARGAAYGARRLR